MNRKLLKLLRRSPMEKIGFCLIGMITGDGAALGSVVPVAGVVVVVVVVMGER